MNIQQIEDQEYELNARYDYASEAYAGLGDDPAMLAYEYEAELRKYLAELDAAFGPLVLRTERRLEDIPF